MKTTLPLICILLLTVSIRAQKKDAGNSYFEANCTPLGFNSTETVDRLKNLKGNIKKITIYKHAANDKAALEMGRDTSMFIMFFNTAKRLTRQLEYYDLHQINSADYYHQVTPQVYLPDSDFVYDRTGKMLTGNWYSYDTNNICTGQKYVSFGTKDKITYNISRSGDTLLITTLYSHLKYVAKKLIEITQQNGKRVTRYSYYSNGSFKSNTSTNGLSSFSISEYDIAGNLVHDELTNRDETGQIIKYIHITNYSYDKNRNLQFRTDSITQNGATRFNTIIYKYGNTPPIQATNDNTRIVAFFFNDHGDIIEEKNQEGDKKFDYSAYDKNNNWTRKIIYEKGMKHYTLERVIEYY